MDEAVGGERLRLLHFVSTLEIGGEQRYLARVTGRLDPARFEQTVAYCAPNDMAGDFRPDIELRQLLPFRPRANTLGGWRIVGPQTELIRAVRPHVVTTHGAGAWNVLAALTAKALGIPSVHTIQRPYGNRAATEDWTIRSAPLRAVAWGAWTRFVALGTYYLADQRDRWKIPPEKLVLDYIGVDLQALRPDPALRAEMRAQLGLGDALVLGIVSRLDPRKGVDRGLRAFRAVLDQDPSAVLVVVGGGAIRGELEALAAALGVAPSVRFLGPDTRVSLWMNGFDAFLQTTHNPLNGITSIEAMACGLPVITIADFDEEEAMAADTCAPGKNGFFFRPDTRGAGSAARSAAEILAALRDPAVRDGLRAASRAMAVERFDLDAHVRRLSSLYEALSGGAKRAAR